MDFFFDDNHAYEHNGDRALLESLGLRTTNFQRKWTELGTVVVREADPLHCFGPHPETTIKVEVLACPAQFWRFTIIRPKDDAETIDGKVRGIYFPLERQVINTGSGSFVDYWPIAKLVAEHMFDIENSAVVCAKDVVL